MEGYLDFICVAFTKTIVNNVNANVPLPKDMNEKLVKELSAKNMNNNKEIANVLVSLFFILRLNCMSLKYNNNIVIPINTPPFNDSITNAL